MQISEDPSTTLNLLRYRDFEGFIASVTPFNFTAISGNLAYTSVSWAMSPCGSSLTLPSSQIT